MPLTKNSIQSNGDNMRKYIAVNDYTLERWSKSLNTILEGSEHSMDTSRITTVQHQIELVRDTAMKVPLYLIEGTTKLEMAASMELNCTYDPALPINWIEKVRRLTGLEPSPHFVWAYYPNGENKACPLTETGRTILDIIEHLENTGILSEDGR